jgi:transposase
LIIKWYKHQNLNTPEVFAGNTKDETTVLGKIREVKQEYQLEQVIFVGDRGMVTKSNLVALQGDHDIKTVSALTHGDLKNLLSREVITPDLFDQTLINEVFDPETPTQRYCLCRNEATESRTRKTRERLLKLTIEGLQYIEGYKRRTTVEKLGARVGKILAKYKLGKFIQWSIDAADEDLSNQHRLVWDIDNEKITQEKRLDGCYIITTDVDIKTMDTQQVVKTYKSLGYVEQAF